MWNAIKKHFSSYPAQQKVAKHFLSNGISVKGGKILAGEIELAPLKIARALDVDRRAVNATVKTIGSEAELSAVFSNIHLIAALKDVAPAMAWGVVEIIVEDCSAPGIIAGISHIIAGEGISIRQAVADDPDLTENPKLTVITESPVPSKLIPRMQAVKGVKSVKVS